MPIRFRVQTNDGPTSKGGGNWKGRVGKAGRGEEGNGTERTTGSEGRVPDPHVHVLIFLRITYVHMSGRLPERAEQPSSWPA